MPEPIDFDPLNNPIHALRLEYGDIDEYDYILSDQSYQYFIDKYPDSANMVSKSIGMTIAANFARNGFRQRVGQEEAYLGERYKNYLDWLKQKVSNPSLSGIVPAVYIGGVFIDTVAYLDRNPELIEAQFYRGQQRGLPTWYDNRLSRDRIIQ